jgi:16S rRNA (uracil1498-N3)-methyltransferase
MKSYNGMNLLLLFPEDFVTENRVRVKRPIRGEEVTVGLANGRIGRGLVTSRNGDAVELEITLDRDPPPPLPLTLVLALPRPKVLNRVIAAATSMGIKQIFLINSWRVEKSYWKSPRLSTLRDQAILGLEQARDTVLPQIEIRRLFRPFVEKELRVDGTLALVAHPAARDECPRKMQTPVTLAIGPEGGFIAEEIASFERIGFRAVTMGPRILRVETAVAALAGRLQR